MSVLRSINPATGEVFGTVEEDSVHQVAEKLADAAAAVARLGDLGVEGRAELMRAAADLLESDADAVAELITAEMGKPLAQAHAEIAKSAHTMRFYAENGAAFLRGRELTDPSAVGASAARTRLEPFGVVLAVMPWNYPVWQVVRFAAPALMAGNAGLLKHASNVPQVARYLGALFVRAGWPVGSFNTLMIGSSRVEPVIRDPRVAAVTLTGSEGAGRSIGAAAGDSLKKVVLELGGSDPFVIMPSADLDAAVDVAVTARTTNSGQACINAKRFIVHEDVFHKFTSLFARRMEALVVGDPVLEGTDVGPLATQSGRGDVEALVDDAKAHGATILVGGETPAGPGWYYPPTVIADLTREMRLWAEEAFGPVASLYKVGSIDEALAVANDPEFGLGSAFWSRDDAEIDRAERELEAGAVFVNGMTVSHPELPFGGTKRSGFGRELSIEGIREFCNLKTVWVA